MSKPTFSVVTAAYNEEDVIASALHSVQRQSRDDWEVWVVDDGSTDATVERVEPFLADSRIHVVSQANGGLSAARNTGIARARGRYLVVLDSDDMLMPDYLEMMGAALDADDNAGFAYTDPWSFDTDKRRFRRKAAMARNKPPMPPPSDPIETMRQLLQRNYMFVGVTIRRSVIDEVGSFDLEMRHCEDLDLWLRILRTGRSAVRPQGTLAIKRVGSGAMSTDSPEVLKYLLLISGRIAEDETLPESLRETARRRIADLKQLHGALVGSDSKQATLLKARLAVGGVYRTLLAQYVWRRRPPKQVREAFPDLVEGLAVRQATRAGEIGRRADVENGAA
jgi:cellulose synthase/poly-beta-1,6-N-acetylglucosamine synthase-like glycosyltransferase